MATGRQATLLPLNDLKSPDDLRKVKIEAHQKQGDWLMGFGWDQNLWERSEFPNRRILDELYSSAPVAFVRADGHAVWTNTEGLKRAGLLKSDGRPLDKQPKISGGKVVVDDEGAPTGVLIDAAKTLIDALIPEPTSAEIRAYLVEGMRSFNRAGFTHIRDMTCRTNQWNEALHLDESGLLTLAVEIFFGTLEGADFQTVLKEAIAASKVRTKSLRIKGVKVFADGALGSEGALLSRCY
jgi:predicted amidohydrolase YtcJ